MKILKLHENEYVLDEETGDITITKELSAKNDLQQEERVAISFLEEEDQRHFPEFKVRKNFYNVRLEYLV